MAAKHAATNAAEPPASTPATKATNAATPEPPAPAETPAVPLPAGLPDLSEEQLRAITTVGRSAPEPIPGGRCSACGSRHVGPAKGPWCLGFDAARNALPNLGLNNLEPLQ
jgi:hypothetical protein